MGVLYPKFLYPDNEARKLAGLRYDNSMISSYTLQSFSGLIRPYSFIDTLDDLRHTTFKSILYSISSEYAEEIKKLDNIPVANSAIMDRETYEAYKKILKFHGIKNVFYFGKMSNTYCFILDPYNITFLYSHVLIVEEDAEKIKLINNILNTEAPPDDEKEYKIITPYINTTIIKEIEPLSVVLPIKTVVADANLMYLIYQYKKVGYNQYCRISIVKEIDEFLYEKTELIIDPTSDEHVYIKHYDQSSYDNFVEKFTYLYRDEISGSIIR